MEEAGEAAARHEAGGKTPERKGTGAPRGRNEGGSSASRANPEPRRKRGEQRYAGFGDGIERAYCLRAAHVLPTTFPVASHGGQATIPRAVVARRDDAILLCTFSHCGPHVWPGGEVVTESQTSPDSDESGA